MRFDRPGAHASPGRCRTGRHRGASRRRFAGPEFLSTVDTGSCPDLGFSRDEYTRRRPSQPPAQPDLAPRARRGGRGRRRGAAGSLVGGERATRSTRPCRCLPLNWRNLGPHAVPDAPAAGDLRTRAGRGDAAALALPLERAGGRPRGRTGRSARPQARRRIHRPARRRRGGPAFGGRDRERPRPRGRRRDHPRAPPADPPRGRLPPGRGDRRVLLHLRRVHAAVAPDAGLRPALPPLLRPQRARGRPADRRPGGSRRPAVLLPRQEGERVRVAQRRQPAAAPGLHRHLPRRGRARLRPLHPRQPGAARADRGVDRHPQARRSSR